MNRARLLAAATVAGTLITGTVTGLAPGAGAALGYTASAAATGVRISETVPGSPGAETLIDGGSPVSQALLAAGGTSTAFASDPYPGPVAAAFPGQLRGLAPQLPAVPDYPYYVSASYPTNPTPDAVASPGGVLTATAGPSEVRARAASGRTASGMSAARLEARTEVTGREDSVRSQAKSIAETVVLGPLTIGSVVSTATVTLQADGQLVRQSSLEITGLRLNDQALAISDGAVVLAGTDVPLPQGSPLAEALSKAGLEISYMAPRRTDNGLISEALVVRRIQDTPNGTARIIFTFGQAVSTIDGTVLPEAPALATSPESPARSEAIPASEVISAPPIIDDAPALPAPGDLAAAASASIPAVDAVAGPAENLPGAPELSGPPAAAPSVPVQLATPAARRFWRFDVTSSYVALAFVTAAAVAIHLVTGGVRRRWSS
jgi:hypothetical protein